jgi:hypothetical protein
MSVPDIVVMMDRLFKPLEGVADRPSVFSTVSSRLTAHVKDAVGKQTVARAHFKATEIISSATSIGESPAQPRIKGKLYRLPNRKSRKVAMLWIQ